MPAAPKRARTMPAARKSRRTRTVPELPVCLLLEITSKLFRREIQSAGFVRRVCQQQGGGLDDDAVVPSRTLGVLGGDTGFSIVHPLTAASGALVRYYLSPFMSRRGSLDASGLPKRSYEPRTSRNGLVVLSRREIHRRWRRDLCVYDPMTSTRAFLPFAPDIGLPPDDGGEGGVVVIDYFALLTAADGIGCSFMLLAADMVGTNQQDGKSSVHVRVQTVSSSDSDAEGQLRWSPVKTTTTADHACPWWCMMSRRSERDAAVVVGGVVHWLMHAHGVILPKKDDVGEYILTYDVNAAAVGAVDVPKDCQQTTSSSHLLASSPDGKKLSFVATHRCTVSVWVLSSSSSAAEGGSTSWERHLEIDMMAVWGPMPRRWEPWTMVRHRRRLQLVEGFGDQRSGAVFFMYDGLFFLLDMETGKTSLRVDLEEKTGIPYDVDLAYRLASMKSYWF